jgi:hypothetical protein
MTKRKPMTPKQRVYGYGIVDRHGQPWWDESCVCQDREPMMEQLTYMNDRLEIGYEEDRAPFRVVRLFWKGRP